MPASVSSPPDVFTAREIARAAGASFDDVHALVESGQVITLDGRFVAAAEAVRAVRLIRGEAERLTPDRTLFQPRPAAVRKAGMPLVASGALHLAMIGVIALMTALGLRGQTVERVVDSKPTRLVFLVRPGPGGGGGGGGLRQPAPAPRAEKKGQNAIRSPIPVRRTARVVRPEPVKRQPPPPPTPIATPVERPVEPPPAPAPDPTPPVVVAPVASVAADTKEQSGVLTEPPAEVPSQGPGTGGGAGTGNGTGIGEGEGTGIGPGSGGGTGGGPYRPGSSVTPPTLLTEIKPDYTEAARRSGITGEVVLEIVVRSDGSVGAITLLSGLGSGLDQRAIDAVRRWRFSPARRHGTPVDVLVEVAVEFRLR